MINSKQTLTEEQFLLLESIKREYETAFKMVNSMPSLNVTIYGGSKLLPSDVYYKEIFNLANKLGSIGWSVTTGGGPGAMAAGIDGNQKSGGHPTGVKINIINESITEKNNLEYTFSNFAPRKYVLRQADAYIFVPGGWGTFDELFEVITLQKVHKASQKKIILFKSEFWNGLKNWLRDQVLLNKLITEDELESLIILDSIEEVVAEISK